MEGTTEHRFMLRPDFELKIVLPSDLTTRDVERVHRWMASLPFDQRVTRAAVRGGGEDR